MSSTNEIMINHDIRNVNGQHIQLPRWCSGNAESKLWGNLNLPDVYVTSATQAYPLGTIYRDGLRTFIYTQHDAKAASNMFSGYFAKTTATHKAIASGVISGASGANTIVVNYGGACAVNKYAGGYICIKGASNAVRTTRYIISNTVQAASTNYVTVTVDGTWPSALVATNPVVMMEDPYKEVHCMQSGESNDSIYEGVMYVGMVVAPCITVSHYMWLQTWGPAFSIGVQDSFEGDGNPQAGIYAYHSGIQRIPTNTSSVVTSGYVAGAVQRVGWNLASLSAASTYAESIFITIHP